jgi:Arc/MetJ-type ribon-helix-helix transcriptional regulator
MKNKLSISMDKNTVSKIDAELAKGLFRNKSHLIEYAVKVYLEK